MSPERGNDECSPSFLESDHDARGLRFVNMAYFISAVSSLESVDRSRESNCESVVDVREIV
jgi:hypothetical protein